MYGAFLLAVYNQDAEEFQTISKIGTGFSEEQLKQFSEQLKEYLVPSPKPYYRSAEHAPIPPQQTLLPLCPLLPLHQLHQALPWAILFRLLAGSAHAVLSISHELDD